MMARNFDLGFLDGFFRDDLLGDIPAGKDKSK